MDGIRISLDKKGYRSKPESCEAARINSRIGKYVEILDSPGKICSFVRDVGKNGYTFSPTMFLNGSKKIDNFEQMQILVLDFDGGISYEAVKGRARQYGLPLLAAYETFSSQNNDRFRILFLNDTPITNKKAAKIYKSALMEIFSEADETDIDISKMYYGGKSLLYLDESLPTIDMESTLMNMTYYFKKKHGDTHYKKYIKNFAKKHKIRLNKKGLLDISVVNDVTELTGTSDDGKNSQNPIIFYKSNGEFLPESCYQIYCEDDRTSSSVEMKHSKGHNWCESNKLTDIFCKCQLYREFVSGTRRLHHHELFGLSTNVIHVATGRTKFNDTLLKYPEYYDPLKQQRWDFYLKYNKESNYYPQQCSRFCDYCNTCNHGTNIISTVQPECGTIERLENYSEIYYPIEEVQKDLIKKLECAVNADDARWHIIKAQTAAGKTEAFLNLMKDSDKRFLIVVPTNILKRDIEGRARKKRLN